MHLVMSARTEAPWGERTRDCLQLIGWRRAQAPVRGLLRRVLLPLMPRPPARVVTTRADQEALRE